MLEGFLEAAKTDSELNIKELMTKEEQFEWEALVRAMDSIDILQIGIDLEKICKTYQLKKWQEMSILAYVKVLEIMVKKAREASPEAFDKPPLPKKGDPSETPYTGSMFG